MFETGLMLIGVCFLTLLPKCLGNPPSYLITTPDVLRVGSEETALVNVFNTDETISVKIYLENYPDRENRFAEVTIDVTADSPKIVKFTINPDNIIPTEAELQYVYLVAKSESPALSFLKEERILLTYRQGYVFIQTDKPLYTPEQDVRIRIIPLTMEMLPSSDQFRLEIINGRGDILEKMDALTAEEETGFYSYAYQFPKFPVFGNWTVTVSYGYLYQLESTIKFEVKEYVLPTYGVKFIEKPNYVLPSTTNFIVSIEAKYVYGKPVQGVYNLIVGYVGADGDTVKMKTYSGELPSDGEAFQAVMLQEIIRDNFHDLVGKHLYLEAVVKSSDGKTEESIDISAPFALTAYKLQTTDMLQYFKAGLPYRGKFKLLYVNNKPAIDTDVIVTATVDGETLMFSQDDNELEKSSNQYGEIEMTIDVPENTKILTITVKPNGQVVAVENGEFEVTINEHVTSSGDSMLIRPVQNHFLPDNAIDFDVLFNDGAVVNRIYFMIVSKGKILEQGTTEVGGVRVTLRVPITFGMTPSARIITYFVDKNNKIVADSLYLDVIDDCQNQVTMTTKDNQKEYKPNDEVEFTLHAKPKTSIGLVAIDEAVLQLRDTDRLSLKKMFDTMEKFDLGCGPGGGANAQGVFEDTGLSTISDVIETDLKMDFGCRSSKRRRRSVPYIYQDETDPKLIEICELGYRIIDGWTCERRTERIATRLDLPVHDPVVQRFYNCCRLMVNSMPRGRIGSDSVDASLIFTDATLNERTDFRESFLFENVVMDEYSRRHDFTLPGSITKWQIHAVSLSPNLGMCVANPLTLTAELDFFIQLDIPYSVVRGEQVEIRATVFNYQNQELRVFMYLEGTEGICSEALAGQRSKNKKDFIVSAKDSYSVTYPMIPLRVGEFEIKVLAFTFNKNDAVTKILRVIPEGVTRYFTLSQILDPTGKLNGQPQVNELQEASMFRPEQYRNADNNGQTDIIDLRLPPDAIEGTAHCKVRFTGSMMGPTISAIIGDVEKMLKKPTGCGEQTLIRVGPNVFVIKYLTQTNQLTADFEKKAFRYLRQGYGMELTFFKPDGSFSVWGPSQGNEFNTGDTSSTWLTAFATKILCHTKDLIFVDPNVICSAIDWLSNPDSSTQREDGAFTEVFRVHHREMTGGVQGDVSFTAYVLITLLECTCEAHAQQATSAIEKAVTFLETEFEKGVITRPFAVAITAYALTLANSRVKDTINIRLREIATYRAGSTQQMGDIFQSSVPTRHWGVDDSSFAGKKPFWYVRRPSAIAVETSSYALLTQILNNDVEYSNPIINWLTEQRNYDGGFVSTQDTIIALQALEAYSKITDADELKLDCTIAKDGYVQHISIDETNALHNQEKTPPVNGHLIIETTGTGIGQAQVEVRYNSDAKTPIEHCAFDVEASATQWQSAKWTPVNGRIAVPTEEPTKVGIESDCGGIDKVGVICPEEAEEDVNTNSPDNSRSRVGRSTSNYVLDIRACARYHGHDKTGMSIIEVGIYSGFKAMKADLDLITAEVDLVKKYELHDRAVVFYLDSIPRDEQVCVNFRATRDMVVSVIQPVAVNVYDYYEPEDKCTDFYHPEPGSDLLNLLCSDAEMCICAAGNCAGCNSKMTKSQLKNEACSRNKDYAFEVNVISARVTASFDVYNCSIEVIKKGIDEIEDTAESNGLTYREFWKSRKCRCPEIYANKKYLIMGVDGLLTTDKNGQAIYKYLIDDQSYVEYWPGVGRNGAQARKRLKKLKGLKTEMELIGCGT